MKMLVAICMLFGVAIPASADGVRRFRSPRNAVVLRPAFHGHNFAFRQRFVQQPVYAQQFVQSYAAPIVQSFAAPQCAQAVYAQSFAAPVCGGYSAAFAAPAYSTFGVRRFGVGGYGVSRFGVAPFSRFGLDVGRVRLRF